jgi:hypothetical protein
MTVQQWIQIALALAGAFMFFGLAWPLGLYVFVGVGIWYVAARRAPGPSLVTETTDPKGLPVVEWIDEYRVIRVIGAQRFEQVRRRCSIAFTAKGEPLFLVESSIDKSGRFLPFGGVIAADALRVVKKALGADQTPPELHGCPWTALQAFALTNENEKFGSRVEKPATVVFADMGSDWGEAIISISDEGPARVADLRRILSREFIERRPEHLQRIATAERIARNAEIGERKKVV